MSGERIPAWQKTVAVLAAVVLVAWMVLDWRRFTADFWPVDKSPVGPNLLAAAVQWAVVLVLAALVWPPTRRRMHRFVEGKLGSALRPLHEKLDAHHEDAREHRRRVEAHNRWVAEHVASTFEHATGTGAAPHPLFGSEAEDEVRH